MIRPWYRSRLFWLGVPGMLFLLWLGWIFPPRVVSVSGPAGTHNLLAYGSNLLFLSDSFSTDPGWDMRTARMIENEIVPQDGPWLTWGRVIEPGGLSGPPWNDYLILRTWLPAAVYLALWIAALASRQLYKHRMMRRAAETM